MKFQVLIYLFTTIVNTVYAYPAVQPAGLIPRQATNGTNSTDNNACRRLLVGAAGQIMGFDFNNTKFKQSLGANVSEPGKTASWMVFKQPNFLYAVDENSNTTRLFNYNPATGILSQELASWNGSSGVVHLAFTSDKSRLIGSSYGQGQVDVWDSSAPDGTLRLLKQVALQGNHGPDKASQTQLRAHQAVLDPSGRYFVINDLGGDKLHILDSANDAFMITSVVQVDPPGSGPRHGAFVSLDGGNKATHYLVVCELTSTVQLFSVTYYSGLSLKNTQTISTFANNLGPANATTARAGELLVSNASGATYVYVSNRNTGNQSDFITRFGLDAMSGRETNAQLAFKGHIMTGGLTPRMFSFSKDSEQEYLFVANTNGQVGLQAHKRCVTNDCRMSKDPVAKFQNVDFFPAGQSGVGWGPQFVMEF